MMNNSRLKNVCLFTTLTLLNLRNYAFSSQSSAVDKKSVGKSEFAKYFDLLTKILKFLAIIGGGIGGTSTAYFLKELLGQKVEIDLFESAKVGGRLSNSKSFGREYEVGGSVIDGRNRYMTGFLKAFGKVIFVECWHFLSEYFFP